MNAYTCPGHPGHIELPVPVYHCSFMDQMMKLLNGQCSFCGRLKLAQMEKNRLCCKLRLLRYGLVAESNELDNITPETNNRGADPDDGAPEKDAEEKQEDLLELRNNFVERKVKKARKRGVAPVSSAQKIQGVSEQRRAIIKLFFQEITKIQTCSACRGNTAGYRKEKFRKVFRKPQSQQSQKKNASLGLNRANHLVQMAEAKKRARQEKLEDRIVDEGIVPDIDSPTDLDDDPEIMQIDDAIIDETATANRRAQGAGDQEYFNPKQVYANLTKLFDLEQEILGLVYESNTKTEKHIATADSFFLQNLLVPPNKYRPEAKTGDTIAEAQQNSLYRKILAQCDLLSTIRLEMKGEEGSGGRQRNFNDFQNAWVGLQDAINSLIDSERNPLSSRGNLLVEEGIKQKLEKKEGLFRKNMMGKRVNFAARSVISPDPNIETNEIGVPPVFAKKLTYPEPVTNYNFYDLKEAVLNGPSKWPGAAAIENENGQVINLKYKSFDERQALANQLLAPSGTNVKGARNKKVHRHLNNGDIVIMNRQPTLHKPSMMCHRAKILSGEKTIRLHYANCNTYNADFDGDEMNLHFPQNENARAEAMLFADTDHQYLVATAGQPLRGLIQDHISMGVWLTNRDTLFSRAEYHQLLYSSMRPENGHTLTERIVTVSPTILKPRPMWTGKQVVTTVLKNITPADCSGLTLAGPSSTARESWSEDSEEGRVIFQSGELLCGILDKAHLGPTAGGFVHSVYEAYGHTTAGKLLSILGRLLTKLLHMRALSCGMDDITLTREGEISRRKKLESVDGIGLDTASKYVTLEGVQTEDDPELRLRLEEALRDEQKHAGLDSVYKSRNAELSSELPKTCMAGGLLKPYPRNQMQLMTTSKAKGSNVQPILISCNLGQQVLEGRRVPIMVSGKSLPSFKAFDTDIRAGGYITDRYLTGVGPQAYFFHAMAGREGLIDTAVKTSRSGYLQRCLIKGMEGLKVEYDTSVRDSDGSIVQFLYGEDGLEVAKQTHLREFQFMAENFEAIIAQLNVQEVYEKIHNDAAIEWQKKALKLLRKTGRVDLMDPVLSQFNPGSAWGSTSESFALALKKYTEENPQKLLRDKKTAPNADLPKKTFTTLLEMKYMKSVVDPGEAVGIVAGQSIGEPSTQMTLNTFHLAGHSAKNVTLGIPRLREIVMTASANIMTPTMTLYLNPETTPEDGKTFAKGITKLTLADVLDNVKINERTGRGKTYERAKIYDIHLNLFPAKDYKETYAITVADVVRAIELQFVPMLERYIRKDMKGTGHADISEMDIGKSVGKTNAASGSKARDGNEDDNDETAERAAAKDREQAEVDSEDEDDPDDDATQFKQKNRGANAVGYDAPDDEEEAIAAHARAGSAEPDSDAEMEDEGYGGSARSSPAPDGDPNESHRHRRNYKDERRERIQGKTRDVSDFAFDDENGSWCRLSIEYDAGAAKILMLNHVEQTCRRAVIQSIPGLGACAYVPEDKKDTKPHCVVTEGVNFTAMQEYQHIIDPNAMISNDIVAVLKTYGVEAARSTIIAEMNAVFKGHGISVDVRHLNLIADYMTRSGQFLPFSRTGLKDSVSPFAKMSFETTVGFLKDAVSEADWDDMRNPSARIVAGKISSVGTGSFDILTPVE